MQVALPEGPGPRHHDPTEEFHELARSAGARTAAFVGGALRTPHPRYYVGQGKVDEIAGLVRSEGAELVIFDHRLSPAQERNLERALQCRVLDRIGLILDIFAQRAQTFEGKLQVELAQLNHLATRLVRGWTHLERQKGGIGLRGPGETQLETDRRLVGLRIRQINRRLEGVRRRRELSRRARRKQEVPVVSLVGYTNAGKSSLFNRLTGAAVLAVDRLFATLDPTLRRLDDTSDPGIVLADTVGFIRDLPPELVAAFRATLEETRQASLLLHVIDAAAPGRRDRIAEVNAVLASIASEAVPQIEVYNKIDLIGEAPRVESGPSGPPRVYVSARTGAGMDLLVETIEGALARARHHFRLVVPPTEARLRSALFDQGEVLSEEYDASGAARLEVRIAPLTLERLLGRSGARSLVEIVEISEVSPDREAPVRVAPQLA